MAVTIVVKGKASPRKVARRAALVAELVRRHMPAARIRAKAESQYYMVAHQPQPAAPELKAVPVGLTDPSNPAESGLRWRLVEA